MTVKTHKIRLEPNNRQLTLFRQSCGVARLAYNVCLTEWKRRYANGEKTNEAELRKWFNSVKHEQFPFVVNVTKYAPQQAIRNLGVAFDRFFKKLAKYPKFKKRGQHDSYYVGNDQFSVEDNYIKLPRIGYVKMSESLRFEGKILSAVISRKADRWFVSIVVEIQDNTNPLVEVTRTDESKSDNQATSPVGIDRGLKVFLQLSDGEFVDNPRFIKRFEKNIRRANKSLSRKVGSKKGESKSSNFKKALTKLQRVYIRLTNARQDFLHKTTTALCRKYDLICLEDLNVAGMSRNRYLSKAILDACWSEFQRQVLYKAVAVNFVGRFDPTTKPCSSCGHPEELKLSDRTFHCSNCGLVIDRDINASINILVKGQTRPSKILRRVSPEVKSVEKKPLATRTRSSGESFSVKQKTNRKSTC